MGTVPAGSYDDLDALADTSAAIGADLPSPPDASAAAPPATSFTFGPSGGPSASMQAFYVTADDQIQLSAWNSNSNLTSIKFQARLLRVDGTIVILSYVLNGLTSDRTFNGAVFQLTEGFLLGVVVGPPGLVLARGQCYCSVEILRGAQPSILWTTVLISNYLTTALQLAWPFGEMKAPTEGPGYVYGIAGPLGGATTTTITVPPNALWQIQAVSSNLVTDAVAGTRQVQLNILSGGGLTILIASAPGTQGPGLGYHYSWGNGLALDAHTPTNQTAPLQSGLLLQAGTVITFSQSNADPGDAWSPVIAQVIEWLNI